MKGVVVGLAAAFAALVPPSAAVADPWTPIAGQPPASKGGVPADVQPDRFRAFSLDQDQLEDRLDAAPQARALARRAPLVVSLPAPTGGFQRFEIAESPIMEPELAARHPGIKTYAGRGIDDPAATIRADTTRLGFHASVRSPGGNWYIDPYYHLDDSVYVSYFGRDLTDDPHGPFVERGPEGEADPLDLGAAAAPAGPEVIQRTYRLALLTDPTYAAYHGGPQHVTAAKVTLMNRVNQIYEDETAIRLALIADNDRLNFDTAAQMTEPDGPCGAAACYTTQQANSCGSATLNRTRIVIGQVVGASGFDIGHLAMGNSGGGIASLSVVGGNSKAQGCTGLSTPVGDFFAVDYVAHEMGHQFSGNHTFNGTQFNCAGGNRSAANSVEPGSGSSIMAYAGICQQDNLQPHSDPYWSQRSFDEITAYVTSDRPPIAEVQTASLRDFDGTDSLRLSFGGRQTAPIVRGADFTLQGLQDALQGVSEVQTVSLADYDTDGDSYRLAYRGGATVPIVRGQNNTAAGIATALQGGNEQQQVVLAGFNGATQSFQVQIDGGTSAVLGNGGLPISNANVAAAVNGIPGFAGTVTSAGAGNTGFTLTFGGASANTDVPAISIVNCTGTCTATVREVATGGEPVGGWPAGGTVSVGPVADSGYALTFSGTHQGTNVDEVAVTDGSGTSGSVAETTASTLGIVPVGATATVAAFGGTGTLNDTGFQVTFGGVLGQDDVPPLGLAVTGGSGFVGETARGGPIDNQGFEIAGSGNHAPVVTTAAGYTIPLRTPFALTGFATDADGDTVTYMWEQNDRGGTAGTALVSNLKANGPLFRQFGTAADVTATDTLLTPSPGLNAVTTDPVRVFPDIGQVVAGNTNAVTGACPPAPAPPALVPTTVRDCFSEFLPTGDYVGVLGDQMLTFRLTARDGYPGAGGIGSAETKLALAPGTGPFLVTSQAAPATVRGGSEQTVTWDVAGTDAAPVGAQQVRITLSANGGATFPRVLAAATPNDGSASVSLPNVATTQGRIKVEARGNVFFDVSDADLEILAAPVLNAAPTRVQYSDAPGPEAVLEAVDADTPGSALEAMATGLPAGLSLEIASTSDDAALPGVRTWRLAGTVTAAPGTYVGSVTVSDGGDGKATTPLRVTVTPEDAAVAYAGETLSSGPVLLRATVRDSDDGAPGDLSKAAVRFMLGTTTLCGPLPATSGAVSCRVPLAQGSHRIDVLVGDHYTGSTSANVRVVRADTDVTAIGDLRVDASAGAHPADPKSPLAFALDASLKRDRLRGLAEIVYIARGKVMRISAGEIESLAASEDGRRAELRAEADLFDHSRLLFPARIANDVTLQVAVDEARTAAISLWDGDTLLFALPEQPIGGGVILVR